MNIRKKLRNIYKHFNKFFNLNDMSKEGFALIIIGAQKMKMKNAKRMFDILQKRFQGNLKNTISNQEC